MIVRYGKDHIRIKIKRSIVIQVCGHPTHFIDRTQLLQCLNVRALRRALKHRKKYMDGLKRDEVALLIES